MAGREVDPVAMTLAAGAAAHTLTDPGGAARAKTASPGDAMIGKDLAHFRIEKRLGKGGMGEVYLATDLALERKVALKVLAPEIAGDASYRERFIREARAQGRLAHPNICHIYFIGEQDGRLFFAMEYVEGENLQERLEREGKIPMDEAVELCRMAAAGLAEAFRHGFTHRDVKPSNLLVDRHGVVKVADFGLVKDAARSDVGETAREAAIVGTPLYMAPEQARGDAVDFRTDIYALGVTLHQLVAGKPPFSGPTPLAVASAHLSMARPTLESSGIRAALVDALCDRMMAKQPDERPAGYDEVITALEELSPRTTRPAGFWVRAMAFGMDILIAGAIGSALASLLELPGNAVSATVIALFMITCHALLGVTPGKAALEIELMSTRKRRRTASGGVRRGVGWRAATIRFLCELGPTYTLVGLDTLLQKTIGFNGPLGGVLNVVLTVLAFAPALFLAARATRNAGKRALWDRVAGTRVVYRRHRGR